MTPQGNKRTKKTYSLEPQQQDDSRAFASDSMFFGIPTTMETTAHIKDEHGEDSWRSNVVNFIHSKWVQRLLMYLLVLDVLLLFTELYLLATYVSIDGLSTKVSKRRFVVSMTAKLFHCEARRDFVLPSELGTIESMVGWSR